LIPDPDRGAEGERTHNERDSNYAEWWGSLRCHCLSSQSVGANLAIRAVGRNGRIASNLMRV
jgi:hypothetical protein